MYIIHLPAFTHAYIEFPWKDTEETGNIGWLQKSNWVAWRGGGT